MGFEKHNVKSVHEGQKFQCPHCEYKATFKWSLQKHIKSVHQGQSTHAHIVNTKQLIEETFRDTSNQCMKAKSFNAHTVDPHLHRKGILRNT